MNFLRIIIILLPLLSKAYGTTVTSNFTVQATVTNACQVSATNLDFGSYNIFANSTSTSTVTVTCTPSTSYTVAFNVGLGTGASFANRKMTLSSNTLSYNLYTSNSYSAVLGDGTGGTTLTSGTGNGAGQDITVYGRVPSGSTAPAGTYQDTIQVTVTY